MDIYRDLSEVLCAAQGEEDKYRGSGTNDLPDVATIMSIAIVGYIQLEARGYIQRVIGDPKDVFEVYASTIMRNIGFKLR